MRFLLDQNLSPKVAQPPRAAGHDVTVARELGLSRATDAVVMATARVEGRVLVSADTDFGALLACPARPRRPSCSCRRASNRRAEQQARLILDNLAVVADDLEAGAVVVLGKATLRIHRLPIGDQT